MKQDENIYKDYIYKKAYERFKANLTDYGSKKKCNYGEKNKKCDAGCRFWDSCKYGKYKSEWKGGIKDAWSNTKS